MAKQIKGHLHPLLALWLVGWLVGWLVDILWKGPFLNMWNVPTNFYLFTYVILFCLVFLKF